MLMNCMLFHVPIFQGFLSLGLFGYNVILAFFIVLNWISGNHFSGLLTNFTYKPTDTKKSLSNKKSGTFDKL